MRARWSMALSMLPLLLGCVATGPAPSQPARLDRGVMGQREVERRAPPMAVPSAAPSWVLEMPPAVGAEAEGRAHGPQHGATQIRHVGADKVEIAVGSLAKLPSHAQVVARLEGKSPNLSRDTPDGGRLVVHNGMTSWTEDWVPDARIERWDASNRVTWSVPAYSSAWVFIMDAVVLPNGDVALAGQFQDDLLIGSLDLRSVYFGGFLMVLDGTTGKTKWVVHPRGEGMCCIAVGTNGLWVANAGPHNKLDPNQLLIERYSFAGTLETSWRVRTAQWARSLAVDEPHETLSLVTFDGVLEHRSLDGRLLDTRALVTGCHLGEVVHDPTSGRYAIVCHDQGPDDLPCGAPAWDDGLPTRSRSRSLVCLFDREGRATAMRFHATVETMVWLQDAAAVVWVGYAGTEGVLYRFAEGSMPPPFKVDLDAAKRITLATRHCPSRMGWQESLRLISDGQDGQPQITCQSLLVGAAFSLELAKQPPPSWWTQLECPAGTTVQRGPEERSCVDATGGVRRRVTRAADGFTEVIKDQAQTTTRTYSTAAILVSERREGPQGVTFTQTFYPSGGMETETHYRPGGMETSRTEWRADGTVKHRSAAGVSEDLVPDGSVRRRCDGNTYELCTQFYGPGRPRQVCEPGTARGAVTCTQYLLDGSVRGVTKRLADQGRWIRVSGNPVVYQPPPAGRGG